MKSISLQLIYIAFYSVYRTEDFIVRLSSLYVLHFDNESYEFADNLHRITLYGYANKSPIQREGPILDIERVLHNT